MKRSPKLFSWKQAFTKASVVLSVVGLGIYGFPNSNSAQAITRKCVPSPFVVCGSGTTNGNINISPQQPFSYLEIDTSIPPSPTFLFEDAIDLSLNLIGGFLDDEDPNLVENGLLLTLLDGDLQATQISSSQIRNAEDDPALIPFGKNLGDLILGRELSEEYKSSFLNYGAIKYEATFGANSATLIRLLDTDGDHEVDEVIEDPVSGNGTKFTFFVPLLSSDASSAISDLSNITQFSQIQAVLSQDEIPGKPDVDGFGIFGFSTSDAPIALQRVVAAEVPEPVAPASLIGFGTLGVILLIKRNKRSKAVLLK